jgi:hypothetical protein
MFTVGKSWLGACVAGCLAVSAPSPGGARAEAATGAQPAEQSPIVLAQPGSFDAGLAAIEKATGARPKGLHGRSASVPPGEGRAFELDSRTATRLLEGSHDAYRKAGLFLFRQERSFGLADEKDVIAVLATPDWRAVVRRMGTAGASRGITTDRIVAWLEEVQKAEPFEITEVGVDYVAGRFEKAPKDPAALAHRIADFAPDMVRGHKDPIAGLADLLGRERLLYLTWD